MSHLERVSLLEAYERASGEGHAMALATVVKVTGSAYRMPGARMLVTEQGVCTGMVSGGCLEDEVREWALRAIATGRPHLRRYDTSGAQDAVFGVGLGCNGIVEILVEPMSNRTVFRRFDALLALHRQERSGVLATVVSIDGPDEIPLGSFVAVFPDGHHEAQGVEEGLALEVAAEARQAMAMNRDRAREYRLPHGRLTLLFEVIRPAVSLLVVGAGNDAQPVVQFAHQLGWSVRVLDARSAFARPERFPLAQSVDVVPLEAIARRLKPGERSCAVVMSHRYLYDREALGALLPYELPYVGVLGPKSRAERMLCDLLERGLIPTQSQIERLHAPVGLDLGGQSPEEIALSVVAEIQAVLSGRTARPLRDRKGPIHGPEPHVHDQRV